MGWFFDLLWGPEPEFKPDEALPFLRHRNGRMLAPRIAPGVQTFIIGPKLPWVNEHKMAGRRPEEMPKERRATATRSIDDLAPKPMSRTPAPQVRFPSIGGVDG